MHSILVVILSACVVQAHANEAPAVDHDELTEEDMDNLVEMLNDDKIADMVVEKLVGKLFDFALLASSPKIALPPPIVQSRPHFNQQAFHPALGVGTVSAAEWPSIKLPDAKVENKAFEMPSKLVPLEERPGAGQISMKNYNSIGEEKRWNVGARADTQTDIGNLYGDPAKLNLGERPDGYADISKRAPPPPGSFYKPGAKELLSGNEQYELIKNGLDPVVKTATDQTPAALKERTGGRPLLSSQSDVLSLSAVLLISVVVGSGVVLAALRFGRSTSTSAFKEPLVGV